jgi:hemerythrin superfamily protein
MENTTMVSTFADTKRMAIAEKLADMKVIQDLLITTEEQLLQECGDNEVADRLAKMIEDDQKNLGVIETSIIQYGIQTEPKKTTQEMVKKVQQLMAGSDLTLYEKAAQHELLKHGQVMAGIVVHKAGQVVGADIEAAIMPLNTVNFENRAHQEQLKGILEVLGTLELTGQKADQGVWARVQDAAAAVTGIVGSVITHSSDRTDMTIEEIIKADHHKVAMLFSEIEKCDDPQKLSGFFGQLFTDLLVHSEAEEQVVYPAVRSFYGDDNTQELYDEQAELKAALEGVNNVDPSTPEFKTHLKRIKQMVGDHTRQEETTMFAAIAKNCSKVQQQQMATQFKEAKSQIQRSM